MSAVAPRAELFNREHREFVCAARLMDMAIQRNDSDEREARLRLLVEQLQDKEKRALLKRGIELWTRTERLNMYEPALPAAKIN